MRNNALQTEATTAVTFGQLKISSKGFRDDGAIPPRYTCDGENIQPPFDIEHIPAATRSMAIIVEDPDAPIRSWVHWTAWNIPPAAHIKEGRKMEAEGTNDFGVHTYTGPCPLSGTHHYFFNIYALDTSLNLPETTSKTQLEHAMSEHIIAFGALVGTYKRK